MFSETIKLAPLLSRQILDSPYYKKLEKKDFNGLVDEIFLKCDSLEPYFGQFPSTGFCILMRLHKLKPSEKQIKKMLVHQDSPLIRLIGFLYLRLALDPKLLWDYMEKFINDSEMCPVKKSPPLTLTIGDCIKDLLTRDKWMGVLLPRIPVLVQREIQAKLDDLTRKQESHQNPDGQHRDSLERDSNRNHVGREKHGAVKATLPKHEDVFKAKETPKIEDVFKAKEKLKHEAVFKAKETPKIEDVFKSKKKEIQEDLNENGKRAIEKDPAEIEKLEKYLDLILGKSNFSLQDMDDSTRLGTRFPYKMSCF